MFNSSRGLKCLNPKKHKVRLSEFAVAIRLEISLRTAGLLIKSRIVVYNALGH